MTADQHRDTFARLPSGEFTVAPDAGLSVREMFAADPRLIIDFIKRSYRAAGLRRARPGTS
jgi:hypothetical protein